LLYLKFLLLFCWASFILYLSSIPGSELPPLFPHGDKLFHLLEYFILAKLAKSAFLDIFREKRKGKIVVIIFSGSFGIFDEIWQNWVPLRDPSFADWLADFIGGILGIFLTTKRRWDSQKRAPS
jgi:VanZ family protein